MQYIIKIDCDNAAFQDEGTGREIARILAVLEHRNEGRTLEPWTGSLLDANGNKVGVADVVLD